MKATAFSESTELNVITGDSKVEIIDTGPHCGAALISEHIEESSADDLLASALRAVEEARNNSFAASPKSILVSAILW